MQGMALEGLKEEDRLRCAAQGLRGMRAVYVGELLLPPWTV
jgi:hypothetical protein